MRQAKEDEIMFMVDVLNICAKSKGKVNVFGLFELEDTYKPRDIINASDFYMHHKRAWYLLQKWCSKGWYDYGVTLDLGWLTDEGKEIAQLYINKGECTGYANG